LTLTALAGAVFASSAAAANGGAHIARQPGGSRHVHYMPVRHRRVPQENIVYHGGPVMVKTNVYAIFWEPKKLQNGDPATVAPGYNDGILQYFKDVNGSGLYQNNTQYYQVVSGKKTFMKNVTQLAGSWVDTAAYPASGCNDPATPGNCVTDAQIQAEVTHAQQVNGWTSGPTNGFFVFTAGGEGTCMGGSSCSFTAFCGYHGAFGNTMYANMPYGATHTQIPQIRIFCTRTDRFPNGRAVDMETNILSHEHIEMATDPMLNAWYAPSGNEIADLCSYNYGKRDEDNGLANQKWNGNFYLLQREWDNKVGGCVQEGP
jgi:hypothetical protein